MDLKPKVLFTDGEGPLVKLDLAQEIMGRITFEHQGEEINGKDFFGILSFYDDYLAEVGTEGYQAGDTLALIGPHLIAHGITDEDVLEEARRAEVSPGAEAYISGLKGDGWDVRVISTAYRPMWDLVGNYLGIPKEDIACTDLSLSSLRQRYGNDDFNSFVQMREQSILGLMSLAKEAMETPGSVVDVFNNLKFHELRDTLNEFYFKDLRQWFGYETLEAIRVMGGRRKVEAAQRFANDLGVDMGSIAYVGDSITDKAMMFELRERGGLPIAINGNDFALEGAVASVATKDNVGAVRPLLDAWQGGGIDEVSRFVRQSHEPISFGREREAGHERPDGAQYWIRLNGEAFLPNEKAAHKAARKEIRGIAADLG